MEISKPQRLIRPTVKVRRLGYLCQISKILFEQGSLVNSSLVNEIEKWAIENRKLLEEYDEKIPFRRKTTKYLVGALVPGTLDASRYINTAENFGLIAKKGRAWVGTSRGDLLAVIPSGDNPFELTINQICMFLKFILQEDYDYIKGFLKTLEFGPSEAHIKFRKIMQSRLLRKMGFGSNVIVLKDAINDINVWKNPKKHFNETIRATRRSL